MSARPPRKLFPCDVMRFLRGGYWVLLAGVVWGAATGGVAEEPFSGKPVYNSQNPQENPNLPQEDANSFQLPEGFQLTLFAGEPDVSQPVSMGGQG